MYRMRWWWIGVMAASTVAAVVMTWWMLEHPSIESSLASPAQIEEMVNHDFEDYYSEYAAQSFAFRVWTNNFWLAAACIALGVFGLPVVYMLYLNVVNLAVVAAIMINHGRGDLFFGLITPHGLLELTCLFVAAGWVCGCSGRGCHRGTGHGYRPSVRRAVRRSGSSLGLVVLLLICGIIEAFVTPSGPPTWARIGIGVVVWAGFWVYVFTAGRWAHNASETGDVEEFERGYSAPVA